MLKCLMCCDPLFRIVHKYPSQQIQKVTAESVVVWDNVLEKVSRCDFAIVRRDIPPNAS